MTKFIRKEKTPDCISGFNLKKKLTMFCVLASLSQVHAITEKIDTTKGIEIAQQQNTISGVVTDENGVSFPGVSISIKGTKIGTTTDYDGKFTLKVNPNSLLLVSYIGYETKEIAVGTQTSITIKLSNTTAALDEVVVVGYGKMKKSDLTGSIVQVKAEALANENPQTVQDLLRGVPGLKVGYSSDAKGGGSIIIRGQNSVYTGGNHNSPLIILDGMQFYGELSEINPDDIGQIDILKDASATAVYGSKAAAGVIIISTKKGKIGKPMVNFTSNLTINEKSAYRDVYSPTGYLKYREDWERAKTYATNTATGDYEAYAAAGAQKGQIGYFSSPDGRIQGPIATSPLVI